MSDETENDFDLISKSQRKRDADAMQALGQKLTELKPVQLAGLSLTDTLVSAIEEYNRLPKSFAARNRQLQFIGRLMRESDFAAIADAVARLESPNYVSTKTKRKKLADKNALSLLSQGDSVISELLAKHPSLDRQQLRQLHREYQKGNEVKQAAIVLRCSQLLRSAIDYSES
ncbi:MAG: ribosome-associated protein [Pseudohongiellaceae bacterium]|jgi:ribosome-associated protein